MTVSSISHSKAPEAHLEPPYKDTSYTPKIAEIAGIALKIIGLLMTGASSALLISSLGISVILLGTAFSISIALITIGIKMGQARTKKAKSKSNLNGEIPQNPKDMKADILNTLTNRTPDINNLTDQRAYKKELQALIIRLKKSPEKLDGLKAHIKALQKKTDVNINRLETAKQETRLEADILKSLDKLPIITTDRSNIPHLIAYKRERQALIILLKKSSIKSVRLKLYLELQISIVKRTLKLITCQGPESIKGIRNGGNSCYMNALFQCIYACPQLRDAFFSPLVQNEGESIEELETRKKIQDMGADILSTLASGNTVININDFRDALFKSHLNIENLNNRNQEDPTELFAILEDTLDIQGILGNTFEYQRRNSKNELINRSLVPFTSIILPIKESDSLEVAINQYFTPEDIDDFKDDSGNIIAILTETPLKKAPHTLPITLKRFEYDQKKKRALRINKKVTIPMELPLSGNKFSDHTEQIIRYRLKSVVCHRSKITNSGHYVAYRIDSNNKWRLYDDSAVSTPMDSIPKKDLEQNSYMLFYERVVG